jgi:deoxyribodipyrimidine photo-lyase
MAEWAKNTLKEHEADPREYVYGAEALEQGQTHNPYCNAAQEDMVVTGKMHNCMRM